MELYLLDEKFSVVDGPIGSATYAVWEERFYDAGSFSVRFPVSEFGRVSGAMYVSVRCESGEICGRVEYASCSGDGECEIGGRLLESLIDDVVMRGGECYTGKLSDVIRAVLEDNASATGVEIDEDFPPLSDEVCVVSTWQNLASWLYSTLKPYGASFRVKLRCGTPTFSLAVGRDRTSAGEGGPRAVFSTSYGNISGVEFERDIRDMKNFAYVCGSDGRVVTVDKSFGLTRREIFKNAGDIVRGHFETEEEYESALIRRGEEILSGYPESVCVFAEHGGASYPTYGKDFMLGDLCNVADAELGLSFSLRVTGAATVFEDGSMTVYPTFGDEAELIKTLRPED